MITPYCTICGRMYLSETHKCADLIKELELPLIDSTPPRTYSNKLEHCTRCQFYSEGCSFTPKKCDSNYLIKRGHACFHPTEPRFSSSWGSDLSVISTPENCVVITGCDQKYIKGAYFALWTLLRTNNVSTILYGDSLDPTDTHYKQIASWGVEMREMPDVVDSSIPFHQTWKKPSCILDALKEYDKVLWIDCDTSTRGSIMEPFVYLDNNPFIPDHGIFDASINKNHPDVHALFGPPKREWETTGYPCAGIVGVSSRDADLVQEWHDRCMWVIPTDLWYHDMYDQRTKGKLKYHDQGILQDLWEADPYDGNRWSNFTVRREGPVPALMEQTYNFPGHTICHYGGKHKPFLNWKRDLTWGDPKWRL